MNFSSIATDFLVSDLKRGRSIFEAYPVLKDITIQQINKEGSNLSFIKSNCIWKPRAFNDEASNLYEDFKNFESLDLYLDLRTAQIFPTVIKERLRKGNSFILNGIDSRSLIFIPNNFKNVACYVSNDFPLKSSAKQCQVFVNEQAIENLEDFFQLNRIECMDLKDLPIKETFYLVKENAKAKNKELFSINMNIIPNQEILDLNEEE